MCIDFDGHHSGGSSFIYMKMNFVITEIVCVTTGASSVMRKNRSMRVPVYSLAPRTRFGSANPVGSGMGCDTFALSLMLEVACLLEYPISSTLMPEVVELRVMPDLLAC